MPKEFYTERDIEDLFKRGILSLTLSDDIALTELAYEKANRLGMQLVRAQPDNPPCAPVRPYLATSLSPAANAPAASAPANGNPELHSRIRAAVLSRMGDQVDQAMLDIIIERVLKNVGVK
jgi:hypothetical protein